MKKFFKLLKASNTSAAGDCGNGATGKSFVTTFAELVIGVR